MPSGGKKSRKNIATVPERKKTARDMRGIKKNVELFRIEVGQ